MKAFYLPITLILLFSGDGFSQHSDSSMFYLKELPAKGVQLNKGWLFYPGDNVEYAEYHSDEKGGTPVNPTLVIDRLPFVQRSGIGWFRLKLWIDSSLQNKTIGMTISLFGAAEVYLNGEQVYKFGNVSADYESEKTQAVYGRALNLKLGENEQQLLAVHYSFGSQNMYRKGFTVPPCLRIVLRPANANIDNIALLTKHIYLFSGITFSIVLATAVLNLFFYFSFPFRKEYLFFGLYFLCTFLGVLVQSDLLGVGRNIQLSTNELITIILLADVFLVAGALLSLQALHMLFKSNSKKFYHFLLLYAIVSIVTMFFSSDWSLLVVIFFPLPYFEILPLCYRAVRKHVRGAWILFVSALISLFPLIVVINAIIINDFELIYLMLCFTLLIPAMGLVIFLAADFARTSSALRSRIVEVQELSNKTIAQEKEKQEILANQKDKLEQEVQNRTEELRKSLSDLKSTQVQLIQSEKMASLGELTAGIAHEIQNPLNFVNNFSEVNKEMIAEMKEAIDKGNYDEVRFIAKDIEDNEEKINHHGKRADAIVKGMLQHSRTSTGIKEPVDINKLADEYLRLAYHRIRAKDPRDAAHKSFNADFKTDFDEAIGKINIVPQDIGRVLLNLFNNAFYAVNEKKVTGNENYEPTVSVSTKKVDNKIEVHVKDNGSGIPQNIIDKIFQPFFTTKPTGQGTGLGLSLAYDIVKAHGGEIKVESEEGVGSTFIIWL